MKTSSVLKAEIAELELARNLAKLSGNVEMVRQSTIELMERYAEIERRKLANEEQVRLYKKALRGE